MYDSDLDDSFDDLQIRRPVYDRPTRAGLHAALAGGTGLGAMLLIAGLFFLLTEEPGPNVARVLVWAMVGIDFVALCAGLAACVLGMQALSPANPLYRGYGILGLVLGVVVVVLSLVAGMFLFCVGMVVELIRNVPGG